MATAAAIVGAVGVVAGVAGQSSASRAATGAAETSAEAQLQIAREDREAAFAQADQVRGDLLKLFPNAEQNINLGFQSGLDILSETIPLQLRSFQEGNIAAQKQLIGGLPQIQNALLGIPIDPSAIQPSRVTTGIGFADAQLPQFQSIAGLGLDPTLASPDGQ